MVIDNISKHRCASSVSLATYVDLLPCSCGGRSWSYVTMGHSLLIKKCKQFFPTWIQITWLKKYFYFFVIIIILKVSVLLQWPFVVS